MRICFLMACVPMIFASGCGGPSDGSAAVTGTIAGKSFASANAVANTSGSGQSVSALVVISDVGNLCGNIDADNDTTNAQALTFDLFEADMSGNTVAPAHSGDYVIATDATMTGQLAGANYVAVGASTADKTESVATAGKVTLTGVASGHYVGSFDLTFGTDHVTGTFDTAPCAALKL